MRLRTPIPYMASAIFQCSVYDSREVLRAAADYLVHRRICQFVPCVQMLFRVVSQLPACLPELSHLFSGECLCRNQFAPCESRLCASSLWDVRCRLKKVPSCSPSQSAQCASGVGSSRSASKFCLACLDELSTACKIFHSVVALLETVCNLLPC